MRKRGCFRYLATFPEVAALSPGMHSCPGPRANWTTARLRASCWTNATVFIQAVAYQRNISPASRRSILPQTLLKLRKGSRCNRPLRYCTSHLALGEGSAPWCKPIERG
ncbi:hypothetical protein BKA70DRAFT_571352 [Coprinopsis sp. MPI-PUGE-AT-0042]|nr:hypothetical protein BKA70DRAFT_571352 [Coprinopsis sp. MPI-PUGE-AT-0042]